MAKQILKFILKFHVYYSEKQTRQLLRFARVSYFVQFVSGPLSGKTKQLSRQIKLCIVPVTGERNVAPTPVLYQLP